MNVDSSKASTILPLKSTPPPSINNTRVTQNSSPLPRANHTTTQLQQLPLAQPTPTDCFDVFTIIQQDIMIPLDIYDTTYDSPIKIDGNAYFLITKSDSYIQYY